MSQVSYFWGVRFFALPFLMADEAIDVGSFCGKHVILSTSFMKANIWKISEKPGLNNTYGSHQNRRYLMREWYFTSMASKHVREWRKRSRLTGKDYCLYCVFHRKGSNLTMHSVIQIKAGIRSTLPAPFVAISTLVKQFDTTSSDFDAFVCNEQTPQHSVT